MGSIMLVFFIEMCCAVPLASRGGCLPILREPHSMFDSLATPSGVSGAVSSVDPWRWAVPGRRTSHSDYTRGQSPETGSLSRLFGSVETTAKCVSVGPVHCRKRLQNPVRFSSASVQRAELELNSRCHSGPHERAGVKTERQEKCSLSSSENHLSGCGVRFAHDISDPHRSREGKRRPVTHCEAVSETAGSDGSYVQCDTYWPAVHESPTLVAQDQGVLAEGKPASHDQGHDGR